MRFATVNSRGRAARKLVGVASCAQVGMLALVVCFGPASPAQGAEVNPATVARNGYQAAQKLYTNEPDNPRAAVQFAQACFDLAEYATNSAQRADIAGQGIAACQQALARHSNSVAAHYFLGMNLGQLARTRGLGALKLVGQMEREFNQARQLDERFDYAGPDRNLGLLYREAPSFLSIGNRNKARQYLERAEALAPNYPENGLNLIESYLKWGERAAPRRQLKRLETVWPTARAEFTGPTWVSSWTDWDARLQKLKKKLDAPSRGLEAPSQKR